MLRVYGQKEIPSNENTLQLASLRRDYRGQGSRPRTHEGFVLYFQVHIIFHSLMAQAALLQPDTSLAQNS